MPANTLKVDRSTRWGNPFNLTAGYLIFDQCGYPIPTERLRTPPGLDRSLDLFAAYLRGLLRLDSDFLEPLRGRNLACWCRPDMPCHADLLLRLANFHWGCRA